VEHFTLQSVNGFAGQVGVKCSGGYSNLTDLVLPDCANPVVVVNLPANGSATGSMNFYPPWTTSAALHSHIKKREPRQGSPLFAGLVTGAGLLLFRLRREFGRYLFLIVTLSLLTAVTGCIGHGGLAMTPGTYSYTLGASSITGPAASSTTTISVTVKCNSCP
jgi:hypothetical protein